MSNRIERAIARAREDVHSTEPADFRGMADIDPSRRFAIGDPQAPIEVFFQILDRYRALGDDGRLAPDTHLFSIGDHFDWGPRTQRAKATEDGLAILSWLAAHEKDRTTILLGNHDLARVSELAGLDDAAFLKLRDRADAAYDDRTLEPGLLRDYPQTPTAEMISRDYSCFRTAQRDLMTQLLKQRRIHAAEALSRQVLLIHAAVTVDDLAAIGVTSGDAFHVAAALNDYVDQQVDRWSGGPLEFGPLFRRSSAAQGEARGIFHHRPSDPSREDAALFVGPPRRRFDPRRLPLGLTQVIGHIRDEKCRKLLGAWAEPGEVAKDGPLRQLVTDGVKVTYRRGVTKTDQGKASIIFIDGGMNYTPPDEYELLVCDAIIADEK